MKKLLRKLYQLLPFKHFIFKVVRYVFKPGPSVYKHLHFKGIIKIHPEKNLSFKMIHYGYQIENELFWAGYNKAWEKVSLYYWKEFCKRSQVIIDVGANTGLYALVAKTVQQKSNVYALEPIERNYNKLVDNCRINNFDIVCLKKALSDSSGEAIVYEEPSNDIIYSVTVNKSLIEITDKVVETKIETIRLDQLIEQNNIGRIDLIKIDVETHEPEVLAGFGKYLKEFQPTILIEVLNEDVAKKVEELISDIPYLYFNIDEKTGVRRTDRIVKSDYFNYLLCKEDLAKEFKLI